MAEPKLLSSQCNVCKKRNNNLLTCGGCKVVRYCSKDHQAADWAEHKSLCTAVKKSRNLTEEEETELRNHPGDFMMPANPFSQPGHFWGWFETRPYMRARFGSVQALQKIRTQEAIQTAYETTKDLQLLNRGDNMGVRWLVPSLMLRLGKDQEAYDYMKWYATAGSTGDYDWGDMELPFLNLQGEDAFEPLSVGNWTVTGRYGQLCFKVAMTLLKLRLLLDLYSLQSSMERITAELPQELLDNIREHLVSDVVASNTKIMQDVRNGVSIAPYIDNIETQLSTMFDAVESANSHFWQALVERDPYHLNALPEAYDMGSVEEMQCELKHAHWVWEETPGAIEWVRAKLEAR